MKRKIFVEIVDGIRMVYSITCVFQLSSYFLTQCVLLSLQEEEAKLRAAAEALKTKSIKQHLLAQEMRKRTLQLESLGVSEDHKIRTAPEALVMLRAQLRPSTAPPSAARDTLSPLPGLGSNGRGRPSSASVRSVLSNRSSTRSISPPVGPVKVG